MKKVSTVMIAVIAIIVVMAGWFISTRNSLVSLNEEVNGKQAQVETQLQRRNDLIPNLVATVQGYANHEEQVFTEIAEARAKLAGSIDEGDIEGINEANNALDSALSRLLMVAEAYPELQASEQFTGLRDELAGTENRISVARQYYNETVQTYNTTIQRFPTSMIASMSGFHPKAYFEADEGAKEAPKVEF